MSADDEKLTWDLDLALQLTRPIGSSEHRAPMIQAVAKALREAYERGATEMRERAAAAAYSPLPDPSWPDVQAYRHGRAQAGAAIRALPALPASKETTTK